MTQFDSQTPPPIPGAPPVTLQYATPMSLQPAVGTWREGSLLVVSKEVSLPDLCVKCNAPAGGWRRRKKIAWHPGWIFLLILVHLFVYVIVALVLQKSVKVEFGLCPVHRAKRRNALIIAWIWFLVSMSAIIGGIVWNFNSRYGEQNAAIVVILVGVLLLIGNAIYAILATRVLAPKRIDNAFGWLKGAGPDFLSNFPYVHEC